MASVFFPSYTSQKSKTDVVSHHQPIARYGHSTIVVGDKMYLWSGGQNVIPITHNGRQKESFISNIESLNLKSGRWEHRQTRGFSPAGLQYYAVTSVGKALYYFGGHCGHSGCYYNSLTKLDTEIYKWEDVKIKNLPNSPSEKYSCGMVHFKCEDNDFLFIVGGNGRIGPQRQPGAVYAEHVGSSGTGRNNEQHIFSLSSGMWIYPKITGDCPPPCSNFSFTSIGSNKAVLFGGYQGAGGRSNDTYVAQLTSDSVHWTKFSQQPGPEASWPAGRCDHAASCIPSHIYRQPEPLVIITGGINNSSEVLRDAWLLYTDSGTWMKIEAPPSIVGRASHSMSVMNLGMQYVWLILFGGAVSWTKGKSTRDQEIVKHTNVLELVWSTSDNKFSVSANIQAESFAKHYTEALKDRIQRRKSMTL